MRCCTSPAKAPVTDAAASPAWSRPALHRVEGFGHLDAAAAGKDRAFSREFDGGVEAIGLDQAVAAFITGFPPSTSAEPRSWNHFPHWANTLLRSASSCAMPPP